MCNFEAEKTDLVKDVLLATQYRPLRMRTVQWHNVECEIMLSSKICVAAVFELSHLNR